jgi:hypothetical protein
MKMRLPCTRWGTRRYLDMSRLREQEQSTAAA